MNSAGDSHTPQAPTGGGPSRARTNPVRWLLRRWPTALAVAVASFTLSGPGAYAQIVEILPLLPLVYLIVAKLRRRQASWPVVAVGFVILMLEVVPPSTAFAAVALVVLVWGAVDGHLFRRGQFGIQALGMLGFGAVALAGLVLDPDLGRYLVAAGWFLHGVWDFAYLKLDKVVARSYAEWCGVLDVLIAAGLVCLL